MFKHFVILMRVLIAKGSLPTIIPSRCAEECQHSAKSLEQRASTMTQTKTKQSLAGHLQDDKPMLLSRRFAPLFWTQFLSAFNDNFLKNTLVFLILFQLASDQAAALVTLAGAIFIAPFLILSALGGEMADRFDKAEMAQKLKLAEIGAAGVAVVGLGMAVVVPSVNSMLGRLVREDQRAHAISRAWMFGMLGFFIGPSMMGIVSEYFGLRVAFFVVALVVAVMIPAILALAKQKRP